MLSRARAPLATLVLGHGASGGPDAPDLVALVRRLPGRSVTVIRVEQPWRLAGRRVAPAPALLDEAFIAVVDRLRPRTPLVVGGRSAGARVACRTARRLGASGCLALAFPLHPPGRPDKSRLPELQAAGVPTLVVQGERDGFGGPAEFPADLQLVRVPEADHSFAVPSASPTSQLAALDLLVETVATWIDAEVC